MKRAINLIIVLIIILSTFMTCFANVEYNAIVSKDDETRVSKDYSKMSSDKFLQHLMDKGVQFEVIDTYYEVVPNEITFLSANKTTTNNSQISFSKKYSVTTKNAIPKIASVGVPALSKATPRDVRMREVQFTDGSILKVNKNDILKNFAKVSIEYAAGVVTPIPATIYTFVSAFGTPIEQYGTSNVKAFNYFYRRDTWFEVKDSRGFYTNMLISETRETKLQIITTNVNPLNGVIRTKTRDISGVVNEYSVRHNKLALNIEDAYIRFNLGYTTPLVHRYYTGTKIINKVGF